MATRIILKSLCGSIGRCTKTPLSGCGFGLSAGCLSHKIFLVRVIGAGAARLTSATTTSIDLLFLAKAEKLGSAAGQWKRLPNRFDRWR
jgi:hypothetical protein